MSSKKKTNDIASTSKALSKDCSPNEENREVIDSTSIAGVGGGGGIIGFGRS